MRKYGSKQEYVKRPKSIINNRFPSELKKKIRPNQYFYSRVRCQIIPKVQAKQKLTIEEQIDYMKYKGITFNAIKESEAKKILSETNYYYKISVVRKLFKKNYSNKYMFLDFSHLVDLSSTDMGIRYFLLQMVLDVEHSIKVQIINDLTNNPNVDPYLIVKQFKNRNSGFYKNTIERFERTAYRKDMYSKRGKNIPFWVLLEIMDMGGLILFLKFYGGKFKVTSDLNTTSGIALYAKNIRNCCAHSGSFIYNIYDPLTRIPSNPRIITYGTIMGIESNDVRFRKINDLVSLFYLHKIFCTNKLNERRFNEGQNLLERCEKNRMYYSSNEQLKKERKTFIKLLDYLKK